MSVRKILAGVATAALATSAISLSAGTAHAADVVDPDDTTFVATTGDLIGVGSDTSQHAMKLFADAWNTGGHSAKIATFAATGGGNIPLPSGAKPRPNGSGAGKAALFGAGNNTDVDFARSSSAQSASETQAGLKSFPFALDTLVMAVSNSTPSNAPASLTPAQIVGIYKGDITNWSQIDPSKSGVIAPKIPQSGSGTRSFFTSQLTAMNGGTAVTLAASVQEVQEHDDSKIKSDPNAIAPFSEGRAGLLGTTLRLETGWSAKRALYNVVRGADLGNALIQEAFGENGALCSTEMRPLIEAAGFKQLATPADGGVCGQATSDATSNFTLNEQVATETVLEATSTKANSAKLVANVSASTSPSGSVDFFEGATEIASNVPLVSGAATYTATGVSPGAHTYTAVFDPGPDSTLEPSQDEATVTVKTSASVSESFPASTKAKSVKGTITVTGDGATATGTVTLMRGSTELKTTALSGGKATFTVKLAQGKNKLKAVYNGGAAVAGASKSFTITKK